MAGPPARPAGDDDVTKQPLTMVALVVATLLTVGAGVLVYDVYGPGVGQKDVARVADGDRLPQH
jgi:hypothetical protein